MLNEYRHYLIAKRRSPETIRVRMQYMGAFHKQQKNLVATTPASLERFLHSNPKWSAGTRNVITVTFRDFFKWALRFGWTNTNPASDLELDRIIPKPSRIADDMEIRRATKASTVAVQAMILMGSDCGLRRAEIAAAHPKNLRGEWLTVIGKGGVERTVHVSRALLAILETLPHDDYYFPGRYGGHLTPHTIYKYVMAAGGFNTHALRHRAGTEFYKKSGKDIRMAQQFLGHKNVQTTIIYVHVEQEEMRNAAIAMEVGTELEAA
jgi:integrase/recombinase XerC